MSTLGSITNSALKSIAMNQLALSVASNNIANANSPEYTRQRLVTTPSGPGGQFLIGTGVDVVRVQALRDQLIDSRLRQETSARSGEEALAHALGDIEPLFTDSEDSGLLRSVSNFFNSFHTLSLDPTSMNFREEVRMNATALMDAFRSRSAELSKIQSSADKAIAADVSRVNTLISQIATVSSEIKSRETDQISNDLRDRRSALIRELSGFVEIRELESAEGDYQLSTASNRLLVLNDRSFQLAATEVNASIGDGSLKARVEVRDTYVPKYQTSLDQLAYEIASRVNGIHSAAYDLTGSTGVNFFAVPGSSSGAAATLALSADVAGDARKIAASELSAGNDNRAALQLGNLLHQPVFTGGAVTEQYRGLVVAVGTDLANAETRFRDHTALETQLENRRASASGVSMEEETVQVLQFQRAYQASARLINTVDELLQTLLGMGR